MDERRSTTAVWIIAALLLLLPLGIYVAGYLQLATTELATPGGRCRIYQRRWQATLFQPAAAVESVVRGEQVSVLHLPVYPSPN